MRLCKEHLKLEEEALQSVFRKESKMSDAMLVVAFASSLCKKCK